MLDIKHEEKKRIIEKRILRELEEFFKQHRSGLQMKVLSGRYGKGAQSLGGITELIDEMVSEGKIRIEYTESGARTIWLNDGSRGLQQGKPKEGTNTGKLSPQKEKVWF